MADRISERLVQRVRKLKRAKGRRSGPPVHDDLCAVVDEDGRTRHVFVAEAPNELWLTDITEHKTAEGKLYLCAIRRDPGGPNRHSGAGWIASPGPRGLGTLVPPEESRAQIRAGLRMGFCDGPLRDDLPRSHPKQPTRDSVIGENRRGSASFFVRS